VKDYKAVAQAIGLPASPEELERLVKPLQGLEEIFRPLVSGLRPEMEPATAFTAEEDGQ
jgi:hypothetical protein